MLASFVLVLGFLAVGLVTTVRRVGNPIGWLLLWQGVVAGFSLVAAAYGTYDLQVVLLLRHPELIMVGRRD